MKILTVCAQGINRSVTAKWLLQFRPENDVLAAGLNLQPETLHMLYDWADWVIVLDKDLAPVCSAPSEKVMVWDVGADTYEHHFNKDLLARLRSYGKATNWGALRAS